MDTKGASVEPAEHDQAKRSRTGMVGHSEGLVRYYQPVLRRRHDPLLCDRIGNKEMARAVRTVLNQLETRDLNKGIIVWRQARYFGVDEERLRAFVDQHLARARGKDTPPLEPVPTRAELELRERDKERRRMPAPKEQPTREEAAERGRAVIAMLQGKTD